MGLLEEQGSSCQKDALAKIYLNLLNHRPSATDYMLPIQELLSPSSLIPEPRFCSSIEQHWAQGSGPLPHLEGLTIIGLSQS